MELCLSNLHTNCGNYSSVQKDSVDGFRSSCLHSIDMIFVKVTEEILSNKKSKYKDINLNDQTVLAGPLADRFKMNAKLTSVNIHRAIWKTTSNMRISSYIISGETKESCVEFFFLNWGVRFSRQRLTLTTSIRRQSFSRTFQKYPTHYTLLIRKKPEHFASRLKLKEKLTEGVCVVLSFKISLFHIVIFW